MYSDFKSSVFRILGQQDNPPVFSNGKVAPIPTDVSTELPTRVSRTIFIYVHQNSTMHDLLQEYNKYIDNHSIFRNNFYSQQSYASIPQEKNEEDSERPKTQIISVNANNADAYSTPIKNGWPPVIWVIGGPGSNKATLCSQAAIDTGQYR